MGVPVNHANAAHWLKLAAEAGHLGAKVKLAGLYLHGAIPIQGDEASPSTDLFATRVKFQPDYVRRSIGHSWRQKKGNPTHKPCSALCFLWVPRRCATRTQRRNGIAERLKVAVPKAI